MSHIELIDLERELERIHSVCFRSGMSRYDGDPWPELLAAAQYAAAVEANAWWAVARCTLTRGNAARIGHPQQRATRAELVRLIRLAEVAAQNHKDALGHARHAEDHMPGHPERHRTRRAG